jgi:hypothetical protein
MQLHQIGALKVSLGCKIVSVGNFVGQP